MDPTLKWPIKVNSKRGNIVTPASNDRILDLVTTETLVFISIFELNYSSELWLNQMGLKKKNTIVHT